MDKDRRSRREHMTTSESGFSAVDYKEPLGDLNKTNAMIVIQLCKYHFGVLLKDS